MDAYTSLPASSPLLALQQQNQQQQARGQEQGRREGEQAREGEEGQSQDQETSSTSASASNGKGGSILVSREMFDTPKQLVQEAALLSIAEFMDMGNSAVECQFEADGDGIGPIFGFGDKVYPEELVDGIECTAWISDRDGSEDGEIGIFDDEETDEDDVDDILEAHSFEDFPDDDDDDDDEYNEYSEYENDQLVDGILPADGFINGDNTPGIISPSDSDDDLPEFFSGSSQASAWDPWGRASRSTMPNRDVADTGPNSWSLWGLSDRNLDNGVEDDDVDDVDDVEEGFQYGDTSSDGPDTEDEDNVYGNADDEAESDLTVDGED